LAFLNARLPDTDEDDLLEAEGLISAAETTLAEQSANADDPLTAKLIATRAEEAKAMMAALAGEKAIRETSVPSPSFETPSARAPQDEGVSGTALSPHPEEPRSGVSKGQEGSNDPVSKGEASKGDDITASPHPEEAAPAAVSKGEGSGGSATTGTDTTDEARAARRDDTRAIDALAEGRERARLAAGDGAEGVQIASADTGFQSDASSGATTATSPEDPPADFDAERNEAPRQSDAQARERDVQPLGAAARRSFEAIDAAERELERQRRRQRAMSRDTAEDRDDPATRGQRQQAVSAEIERAEDQLGKVRTEARDAIMERLVTGSLDPASAKAEAETVFGTDDPVVGQVQAAGVVVGLRELEERALDKPENAGAAADFVAGLRGEAEQDGSLTAEAKQFFSERLANANALTKQAGVLDEANRELDRLATEIDALEQKRAGEGLNARERQQLRGLKASQQAAVDKVADAQAAFDEAAEPLVKLEAARALAALMETAESPEQLRDELFNVAEAALDGAAGGALAGLVTGGAGGAAIGAIISAVASGASTFLARQGIDPADLAALPRLLKEDPAKAIAIIDDVGDAKFVAALAGSLAGGIKLTPKPGFDPVDAGIGAAASEGFKTLRRQ
ncbi:hypothetical protein, partial [Limibacillus halophilus]|uniref:hypothetical protein n=1 Tax=Limibacillus halophilus TaxID=1579333 RepID=UPI00160B1720